jgi:ADP-ribosyl-[dinitrogen reductase] hydrolase
MIKAALIGLAVGDALGVPVEFENREYLRENPMTDMIGYGTYNQPPGTWSDDSSLTFCLAEALTEGYDPENIGRYFVNWLKHAYWTSHGTVFDVGIATRQAIGQIAAGTPALLAGCTGEYDNGNGSLMRILPLLFYSHQLPVDQRFQLTREVSSLTHAHIRSVISCFYYLEFARRLLYQEDKFAIYHSLQSEVGSYLQTIPVPPHEIGTLHRLLQQNIHELPEEEINSSGYVIHTLEASIWCLLTTGTYEEAVLKAVNLGDDTDTTGAVTGGLAGLLYGFEEISERWVESLARREDIVDLAERVRKKY